MAGGGGGGGGYPGGPFNPLLGAGRPPPPPGSFSHFPPGLLYWPGCGYPSPPISPTNYFMPGGQLAGPPSSLLTTTSPVSSPGQDQPSPTQPTHNTLVRSPFFSQYSHSNWSRFNDVLLSLVEMVHSVDLPALLCHKEPAQGT